MCSLSINCHYTLFVSDAFALDCLCSKLGHLCPYFLSTVYIWYLHACSNGCLCVLFLVSLCWQHFSVLSVLHRYKRLIQSSILQQWSHVTSPPLSKQQTTFSALLLKTCNLQRQTVYSTVILLTNKTKCYICA